MYLPHEVKRPFEIIEFFTAFEYSCDNSYSFEGELHNFWEIVILKEGELCIMEDDRVCTLTQNQIIFHKPKVFHNLQVKSERVNYIVISFNVVGNYIDRFANRVINLSAEQMEYVNQISAMFKAENLDSNLMKITKFLKIIREKPVLYHRFINIVELLLISLSESNMISPKIVDNEETQLYKIAIKTLEENICTSISVTDLAKKCNVSTAHLKRIFNKYAGIGIHEYFLQHKILYAKKLLSNGMGVTEVAEKMSFSSQNYFSVVFKRKVGMSPLRYKKEKILK